MSDIKSGYLFVPSEGSARLSSVKLNAQLNGAIINSSFVSSKPAVSSVTSSDQLLLLKSDGTYARVPATAVGTGGGGGGDMYKSTYDANANNLVDHAELADAAPWTGITGKPTSFTPSAHASTHLSAGSDPIAIATATLAGLCPAVDNTTIQVVTSKLSCVALAWTAITGKPSTFPPDATAMLKSVYDTNADNIVDHAALSDTATNANAVPWTGVSGKPATFTPSAHASTHVTGGSDVIAAPTTSASGAVPVLPATLGTSKFLRGDVTWTQPDYSNLTGLPGSFTPVAHANTHLDNGTDPVPVATTTRTGSLRILSGSATQYLDGSGAWSTPAGTGPTVDPGVWTALTPASGWSAGSVSPQYRVETLGTVKSVYCRGTLQGAWAAIGTTAFTFPSAAFPSAIRSRILSGYQNTGTASDVASYVATVSAAGVVIIYFLAASNFVWADHSQTQVIYLDGLIFSI